MQKSLRVIVIFLFIIISLAARTDGNKANPVRYVNPLIGTAKATTVSALKHGSGTELNAQVQPSVTVPFGMTNFTPQTHNSETKCLSSYYYKDTVITGFRGSHWLSGSCTQEYGSMAVMPVSGELICNAEKRGSVFTHSKEVAAPNYYKVLLERYNIQAELTAATRCGILRFTYNKAGKAHIVVNPNNERGEGYIKVIPGRNEIAGYNPIRRIYQGWGKSAGFSGYFVVRIEKKADDYGVYCEDKIEPGKLILENENNAGGYFSFTVKKGEKVYAKIGTSFVSIEQARKNLDAEIPGYEFDKIKNELEATWNKLLSKITVEGNSIEDKVKFYTAMYHCFQQPRIYNDVDGSYPGFGGNAGTDTIKNGNYYCDFSIWDTYRGLHPLFNIIIPEQNADMLRSLLTMGKAGGWLPIFPKWNSYTSAMIGDHAIALIAEAYIKGNIQLNEEDYKLLRQNACESPSSYDEYVDGKGRRALTSYLKYGYIPLEDSVKEAFHKNEQVSRTLEYAYDDYCLAMIAKKMGKEDDSNYFFKRSRNYKNVYDPSVKNMNGRYADGTFFKGLDREKFVSFITEGTPWQYNWYVPQDVPGLIEIMGGKDSFNRELDAFFDAGQYWHGNEPGHQVPFLYNYSGQPWRTQKIVDDVLKEEYGNGPGGLSGNDDAGQMSAWYVLGAVGIYPVNPVSGEYQVSGPKFKKISFILDNGKKLVFEAPAYSKKNIYIDNIKINGEEYSSLTVNYKDIMNGGNWLFNLSDKHK
jgi:predicted alpha-1,2-mannosidase